MNQPLYTTEILRLAASLLPFEPLSGASGAAERRSTTCGSTIRTEVRLEGDRLVEMRQKVNACAFGQASAALTQQVAMGRTAPEVRLLRQRFADWLTGTAEDAEPFAPLLPARTKTARHSAMLLPLDTLIAALEKARP